jgi:hypothetical protein
MKRRAMRVGARTTFMKPPGRPVSFAQIGSSVLAETA